VSDERRFWLALRGIESVGNITFRRLLDRFDTPSRVLSASFDALTSTPGVPRHVAQAIVESRGSSLKRADEICRLLDRLPADIVTITDSGYPPLLREIVDPSPFLFVRGTIPAPLAAVAVVGSRRATRSGMEMATRLSADLSRAGLVIVSGFARGIDTAAHRGALEGGGKTIAVLGCGVDIVYPPENRKLLEMIVSEGCVISEYFPGTPPHAGHFPRRNRIISGISRGVVVVEAAQRSGTLITAQYALEQGRDVFAVPGSVTSGMNGGCHWLIKQGAKLVENAQDVLEEIDPSRSSSPSPSVPPPTPRLSSGEQIVFDLLSDEPRSIDDLAVSSGLTPGELSSILLRLELAGVIIQLPGKLFARS